MPRSPLAITDLRQRGLAFASARRMSVAQALEASARVDAPQYDVFLSQAIKDQQVVLGVYAILTEDLGLTVFCDWLENSSDHSTTTIHDAAFLRQKLSASRSLVFIDSENSQHSTWMSWEVGWFDAANGRICVLPVADEQGQHRGREFLGLYPVVEKDEKLSFVVSVPLRQVAARYPPGTPLGIATRLPLAAWATMDRVPDYFLSAVSGEVP